MKTGIMRRILAVLAISSGLYFLHSKNVMCVASQWDHAEKFYCTKGQTAEVNHLNRMNYAIDVVMEYAKDRGTDSVDLGNLGPYDVCLTLAESLDVPVAIQKAKGWGTPMPLHLTDDHPVEVQDACAVVLHGAEF